MKRRKRYSVLIAVVLAMAMQCGCGSKSVKDQKEAARGTIIPSAAAAEKAEGVPADKQVSFADKWTKAVNFIQQVLAVTPGANEKISKKEIDAQFASLIQDIKGGLNDESVVYYRLCSILASMQHVHMGLYYTDQSKYPAGEQAKLDFIWTQEGLVLLGADEAYKEDVGWLVTKINGCSLKEIMDKYASIQCEETETGKKNCFYNLYTADLKYLGIMKPEDNSMVLTLKNDTGQEKEMIYTFTSDDHCNWCTFINREDIPFTYRVRSENNDQNYCYVERPKEGIMYFQYLACADQQDMPFYEFFTEMIAKMKAQDKVYDTLVIDVRWNGGGNRSIFQEELIKYKDYLKNKHICIITGDWTTSAGVQLIEDCLSFLNDVTIYGGPTCGAVHNYTEIRQSSVPGTDLVLQTPTELDVIPQLTKKYGDVTESAMPDVPVEISLSDFKKGIDTIYARIVKDKEENKK